MVSEHRHPRGLESARPGSGLTRVERGKPASGSTPGAQVGACGGGRPRVIGAESPGGTGCPKAERVKAKLAAWLAPRGLMFNEAKTRIVHLTEGFDFLGFNLRRYHC
jgi:hypothetical protein